MMRGAACNKNVVEGNTEYKAITNEEACIRFQVSSVETTIRMMRLTYLQNLVAHPEHHELVLTALFGKYTFEQEVCTNPWLDQWLADIH
eukprot:6481236-Karenia_brevis.AAC.1